MLKVKTKLGQSNISGIGLFAAEFIPKNTIIWAYTPLHDKIYTEEEFNNASEIEQAFLFQYCFKINGRYILCVDNARFVNHSDTPNCYSSTLDQYGIQHTKALRDISPGEELSDNYYEFGLSEEDFSFNSQITNSLSAVSNT